MVPSSVTTRARTMTVRNGSSGPLTRASRNGSISSLAVASRIVPRRCSVPSESTNPFGRVKLNSVCNAIGVDYLLPAKLLSGLLGRPLELLVGDRQLLDHDVVAAGVEVGGRPPRGP